MKLKIALVLAFSIPGVANAIIPVTDAAAIAAISSATTAISSTTTAVTEGTTATTQAITNTLPSALIRGVVSKTSGVPYLSLGMVIQSGLNDIKRTLDGNYAATSGLSADVATKQAKMQNEAEISKLNTATINNQQAPANTCETQTLAAVNAAAAAAIAARNAEILDKMAKFARSGARGAGGGASAAAVVDSHKKYCDRSTDKSCVTDATNPLMMDADKKAESILYGAGNAKEGVKILTYTQEQEAAALVALQNMTTGSEPPRTLSKVEAETPPGTIYQARKIEYDMMVSAASIPMAEVLASRSSMPNSSDLLKVMRKNSDGDSGVWMSSELDKIQAKVGSKISPADLLRIEIGRRVDNPGWMKDIQAMNNQTSLLRELIFMEALSLKMQYAAHLTAESQALVQGSQAINTIKSRLSPELDKLGRAAVASASN